LSEADWLATYVNSRSGNDATMERKTGRSLTSGPIAGALIAFALPTLASSVLQTLNGSINAVWVGQLLGPIGLAATSNANLIMFMIFALIFGFGMATTILIGQYVGRRDLAGVRRTVGAGLGLFLATGLCAAIAGWIGTPGLLHLLGTPQDVYPMAFDYCRVMFIGLPPTVIVVYLQMALRGTGDSRTPLLLMIPGAIIDVAMNPVLILGLGPAPRMGISGAASAGVIAGYASLLLLTAYIYFRDLPVRLRGVELRYLLPSRALVISIVRMGFPMGLQMIVASVAALAMMGLVNREGSSAAAAYGAVNQLWGYMAIGAAVSAMAAQNIGAGLWHRVDRITAAGVAMNLLLTGLLVLSLTIADRFVLSLFLSNHDAVAIARHINLLTSWSFILIGVTLVLSAVPRANGATVAPLIIMTLALIPGRLGVAFLLTREMGPDAIWWSFPIGSGIAITLSLAYYLRGSWRKLRPLAATSVGEAEEFLETESEPAGRMHPAG
jgi:putative MATE family efflux protein